ncbi:Protein CBR-NCX-3 [Dirofilaria immitis]|nr:Protein CBR-NCX-3 [Dirofilaria immitis]
MSIQTNTLNVCCICIARRYRSVYLDRKELLQALQSLRMPSCVRSKKLHHQPVKLKHSRRNSLTYETAGSEEGVEIRAWNPTVANLTLMALGSSAPEILLSVIEISANHFRSGDLGPGTIVGSAAFNLLCITAVCILAVPSSKVKRIQETFVFAATSLFSCLAYIWLLIILMIISPNIVELWEALLTFGLFFVLIIVAYLVDIKIWKLKKACFKEEIQIDGVDNEKYKDDDIDIYLRKFANEMEFENNVIKATNEVSSCETLRHILRRISRVYPNLLPHEQSKLLACKLLHMKNHGYLQYRLQVIRRLAAASRKMDSKLMLEEADKTRNTSIGTVEERIEFSARVYSIVKGSGRVMLRVIRHEPTDKTLTFRYSTKDSVAKKDLHFLSKSETVQFKSNEKIKEIYVDLVENAEWQPGDVFYVHLKLDKNEKKNIIGETNLAVVQIVKENEKYVRAFITYLGQHNEQTFNIYYKTEAITAKCDKDYEGITNGVLTFVGNEPVTIGPNRSAVVTIICDDNVLKNIMNVRKLASHYFKQLTYGSNTWLEHLIQATSVNAGDTENATMMDCLLHILSFPWKIMAALIPHLQSWADAITLVALGTSLPDTFASKIAAQNDITADNAIGNITGSNAVNVFVGLGLPWTIAAIYCVAIFMITSTICMLLLITRRLSAFFGKGNLEAQ